MSARSISGDLIAALKRLRLGGLLPTLAERLILAEKEDTPYEDVLLMLLVDEISRRDSTASIRRADQAGLDPDMVLERWDKSAKVTYDRRVMNELGSLRFVEDHRNVVILGPVGVGKTFLANALGHLCCRAGFNVRMLRADALLRLLKQSRMDNSRDAVMTELATVDVLIIDDFALEPMSREESRDIYQLFVERNARLSTVVTSNRDTAEWIAAFDDALLAQSAVDRFKNNAFDLVVDGESYRSRLKPNIEKLPPPPSAPVKKVAVHPRTKAANRPSMTPRTSAPCRGLRGPPGSTRPQICGIRSAGLRCPSPGPMILATAGPIPLASDTLDAFSLDGLPVLDVRSADLVDVPVAERRDEMTVLGVHPALLALRRLQVTRAELSLEQGRRVVAVLHPLALVAASAATDLGSHLLLPQHRLFQREPLVLLVPCFQRAGPRIQRAHAHAVARFRFVNACVLGRLAVTVHGPEKSGSFRRLAGSEKIGDRHEIEGVIYVGRWTPMPS